ncbi:MAG: helix-loop-helix domain-containing protein [Cytophagales bacterium]|nr:helix-loop-helix domain-containing protein [Cytophagales bacterium]
MKTNQFVTFISWPEPHNEEMGSNHLRLKELVPQFGESAACEMQNDKRYLATARERMRCRFLVSMLNWLADHLPIFPSEKPLKQKDILLLAINYIQLLEDLLHGGHPYSKWKR